MASSISASVGAACFVSSATADMICPGWQYPHCGTLISIHACCTGWLASLESPSMVVIFFPATVETGVTQDRAAAPSMCTVHAPQSAIPQPNLVPVMASVSRNTHSKGISGLTSTDCGLPFNTKLIAMVASESPHRLEREYPTTIRVCSDGHEVLSQLKNCPKLLRLFLN